MKGESGELDGVKQQKSQLQFELEEMQQEAEQRRVELKLELE